MILALECSTTSAKALLFDVAKGAVVRVKSESYPGETAAFRGVLGAQDTLAVIALAVRLGKEVADGAGNIDAIALGGTFHSVLVCDKTMEPLTPTYTWMYSGAEELTGRLRNDERYTLDYYHRTGCMVHALYAAFHLMKLREDGFDFDGKRVSTQGAFLFYALTGTHLETASTNSGGGLINSREKSWDRQTIDEIGISPDNFANLATYHDAKPLSDLGAALLGLKSGIPVLPSYPDGGLNQVGSGALQAGSMTFSMGTSAAIRLSVPQPLVPAFPSTWCYLSPYSWMSGAAVNGACNCVDWLKPILFPSRTYAEVESLDADYGNMPYFLPFLFGERCPGWNDAKKGGFYGMRSYHTPVDMYYSALEGILFNVYQCYEILREVAEEPKEILLSGGILNSNKWKQMCADIFNREMFCEEIPHASLIGAAVLALEYTGNLDNIKNYRVKRSEVITPREQGVSLFAGRYQNYLSYYGSA